MAHVSQPKSLTSSISLAQEKVRLKIQNKILFECMSVWHHHKVKIHKSNHCKSQTISSQIYENK